MMPDLLRGKLCSRRPEWPARPRRKAMSGNDIVITRARNLNFERWVRVSQGGRFLGTVDPQELIRQATGHRISREACIVSFADGISAAGLDVYIEYAYGKKGYKPVRYVRGRTCLHPIVLVYFLCGLAWAKNEWLFLAQALRRHVRYESRIAVLESTAQRYFNDSFSCRFGKLSLVINS